MAGRKIVVNPPILLVSFIWMQGVYKIVVKEPTARRRRPEILDKILGNRADSIGGNDVAGEGLASKWIFHRNEHSPVVLLRKAGIK